MDRRLALRQLILLSGATVVLPSYSWSSETISVQLESLNLSANEKNLIALISDTIIPPTSTPGAKQLGVPQFIMRMVDDCFKKQDQQAFTTGLNQVENFSMERTGKSFTSHNQQSRITVLKNISEDSKASKELKSFVNTIRWLTIQGYSTSEYVMTKREKPYKLVPGPFKGCVKA